MSLQPLDTTDEIPDAYSLAVSESRRWLVLGYTSRSTLGLRAQGIGLPDLRKQLEKEEEVLFGFLRFRRRGIVLQYTNPDCSRVVKARAQVHLPTILNFFRDNDFLLETSTPKDITLDNIARLTNSTSTSTINSCKKSKRLTDIMEESPIFDDESMDEEQASPISNSDENSLTGKHEEESSEIQNPVVSITPRKKILLKQLTMETGNVISDKVPRFPLPPSPLRRVPSSTPDSPKADSEENQRDSYDSTSTNSTTPPPEPSPPVVTPVVNEPVTPPPPEKLRLLKALEIRRRKLSGQNGIPEKSPVVESTLTKTPIEEKKQQFPIQLPTPPPSVERLTETRKARIEEYKRHIEALEQSSSDLLNGWINYQSSTSLVFPSNALLIQLWRRKFIRITSSRILSLNDTQEHSGTSQLQWNITSDIRNVEIPDPDEEPLPHSLRISLKSGLNWSVACQTSEDLKNLRRGRELLIVG